MHQEVNNVKNDLEENISEHKELHFEENDDLILFLLKDQDSDLIADKNNNHANHHENEFLKDIFEYLLTINKFVNLEDNL